jgi:hypothetical protein
MTAGRLLVKWIFLGLALALAIVYGSYQHSASVAEAEAKADPANCQDKAGDWVFTPAGSYRRAGDGKCVVGTPPPPPAPHTVVPAEKPWTFRTLEIPAGGLAVQLYSGWKDFAFGGDITITTPNGQVLRDQPGVNHQWGLQPDGLYVFLADPAGSKRSVQILNRW